MNTRTIYKRLYKSKSTNFWGERTYAKVTLPTSIFSVPPPPLPEVPSHLREDGFSGWFIDVPGSDYDRATEWIRIYDVFGSHPRAGDPILSGTLKESYGSSSWWECTRSFRETTDQEWQQEPYDKPWIRAWTANKAWTDNAQADMQHPLLQKLAICENYTKSTFARLLSVHKVQFEYGVKTYNLRGFAAALSRANKLAAKLDVPITLSIG